jgi:transposase
MARTLDLVGVDEIAQRLGVSRGTVSMWQTRGWPSGGSAKPAKAPQPVATISGRMHVYRWSDVERWARATGRLD